MDYQKFSQDFESSGLSQAAYGKVIGMSSSMVSYYLNRAKKEVKPTKSSPSFTEVRIPVSTRSVIKIKTAQGIEIEIPI